MISSLAAALAVLTFVSLTTWRNRMKWSPTVWIMCVSSMTVRMQQPFQSNRPMHIYSWAATMLQVKPKIITTSLGWLTMLRKTTAFRPYSKILQLSSTEKVLVQFHFSVSIDYFSPYVQCYLSHFKGVWDAEGGGGKTGAERAALHGFEINTAFDLYNFLKQHHSTVTNSYHEALHQVDKREFHYFPRGTFLAFHPRR